MKILTASAITIALLAASPTLAQHFNTGRPSFDNPRDYDRDIYGNETYYPRNAWFGDRYNGRPPAHVKKKKHRKKKIHNN